MSTIERGIESDYHGFKDWIEKIHIYDEEELARRQKKFRDTIAQIPERRLSAAAEAADRAFGQFLLSEARFSTQED